MAVRHKPGRAGGRAACPPQPAPPASGAPAPRRHRNNPAAAPFAAACSRTARRLFWYLLACAIGVVVVRWLQSIEGVGMMWVFLSAVSQTDTRPHKASSTLSACRRVSAAASGEGTVLRAGWQPLPKTAAGQHSLHASGGLCSPAQLIATALWRAACGSPACALPADYGGLDD